MADSLSDLKADTRFWQRLLRLGGYYEGKTDGIAGPLTKAAEQAWLADARKAEDELGSFDERSERNIATLIPKAQRAARKWLALAAPKAEASGCEVKIICGTRTYKEQDALYAQGRTTKGSKVTNAKGGHSMHNFGIAWDMGVFQGKSYFGDHALYSTLGRLSSQVGGVEWGGDWTSFVDQPHLQLDAWGSTSSALRKAFEV